MRKKWGKENRREQTRTERFLAVFWLIDRNTDALFSRRLVVKRDRFKVTKRRDSESVLFEARRKNSHLETRASNVQEYKPRKGEAETLVPGRSPGCDKVRTNDRSVGRRKTTGGKISPLSKFVSTPPPIDRQTEERRHRGWPIRHTRLPK